MGFERGHRAGPHIACDADFQRDALFAQAPQQIGIFHRANAMADAFRADIERGANGFRAGGFARMRGQAQSGVLRISVGVAEFRGGPAHFVAADAERDHAVIHIARRELCDLHDVIRPELPDRVQIPPDFDGPMLLRLPLRGADGPPDGVEIKSEPLNNARAERHFGVGNALRARALRSSGG